MTDFYTFWPPNFMQLRVTRKWELRKWEESTFISLHWHFVTVVFTCNEEVNVHPCIYDKIVYTLQLAPMGYVQGICIKIGLCTVLLHFWELVSFLEVVESASGLFILCSNFLRKLMLKLLQFLALLGIHVYFSHTTLLFTTTCLIQWIYNTSS